MPGEVVSPRVTVPEKLFRLVRVRVDVPEAGLTSMVGDAGFADIE